MTSSVVSRYEDVTSHVTELQQRLQSLYMAVHNFREGVDLMYRWTDTTQQSMNNMTLVSNQIHILIRQIRELKVGELLSAGLKGAKGVNHPKISCISEKKREKKREKEKKTKRNKK